MSASADPLLQRRIGSYTIERRLGAGGMGAVYVAVQPEIGKRVAVKFIAAHLASDPEIVTRFFDEARAVNLIAHENIVDIFDFGRTGDGYSYFIMELLQGRSLAQELEACARLPFDRTRRIARQIADAVTAAHGRGIVHRDLKPDNVFLVPSAGRPDFVKVLDFGVAKLGEHSGAGRRTVTGMVLGTPGFMPPEQAQGEAVDGRADVYALGVMLYRMLGGEMPFAGSTLISIVTAQLEDRPRPLAELAPDVDPPIAALIHRMIAADPRRRPSAMSEVLAHLADASPSIATPVPAGVAVPPTRVRPQAPAVSSPRWPGALRWGAAGAAAMIVFAVGRTLTRSPPGAEPRPAVVAPPQPPTTAPPKPATSPPAAPPVVEAPRAATYEASIVSTPPGATIFDGAREIGTTPTRLVLDAPRGLRLHLSGFFDATAEVGPDHADVRVKLERVRGVGTASKPPAPRHGIGLDD